METKKTLEQKIIETVNKANEILQYIKDNNKNVVIIDCKCISLTDYLFDSKDYPFDIPFDEYITKYNNNIDSLDLIDDEYIIDEAYVNKFISYVNNILIPRYVDYALKHRKYHCVYKIQYTSKDNSINIIPYVEELGAISTGVLYYRDIENINKGEFAIEREYFDRPMLRYNTEEKQFIVTIWAYEDKIKTANMLLSFYLEGRLIDVIQDIEVI